MIYFYFGTILVLLLVCVRLSKSKKELRETAEREISNQSLQNKILTVQLQKALSEADYLKRKINEEKTNNH
jgi:biopolymer transport protein ExbB/TolQ